MMTILITLFVVGLAAALIASQADFQGEQIKQIHERNWGSEAFDSLTELIGGKVTDYYERVPVYVIYADNRKKVAK